MEQSQDYSFNKAHSACYALIAYRTAYLKANHPAQYMAALISSVMNTKDRVPFYVNACHEMGIEVLPPDVNESAGRLRCRRDEDPLRPERGQERRRVRVPRDRRGARGRAVHVDLGVHRARRPAGREQARARVAGQVRRARLDGLLAKGMLDVLEQALQWGGRQQADRLAGQGSIFDLGGDGGPRRGRGTIRRSRPTSTRRPSCCALEKETLGLYVSEHPLARRPRPAPPQDRLPARRARAPPRR